MFKLDLENAYEPKIKLLDHRKSKRVPEKHLLLLLLSHFSRVQIHATPQTLPTRLPRPWDSPAKNTGVGCHFLLQRVKVKTESETLSHVQLLVTPWTTTYQALLHPWDFPGENTRVGCHCLLPNSALLTMPKPLTVWITTDYGKFFKRWQCQTI